MFAKFPEAGRVKTRLAARVGVHKATDLYKGFLKDLIHTHEHTDIYDFAVALFPPDRKEDFAMITGVSLRHVISQSEGDLGEKLTHAFLENLQTYNEVIVIGSDLPDLTQKDIAQAFEALAHHDVVIGPTFDGGYYLIGMKAPHPELFTDIPWSTNTVFSLTEDRAKAAKLSVHILPVRRDIDTIEDLVAAERS